MRVDGRQPNDHLLDLAASGIKQLLRIQAETFNSLTNSGNLSKG